MYKGHKIGISIPAYNEEKLIWKTLEEIPEYIDKIYVCDDCSKDRTSEIVKEFMKKDQRVDLIKHEINTGVGGAIVDGWKKGLFDKMDILAVMAGDNQMDPKYLPDLIDPIIDGKADYTKGNRLLKGYIGKMSKWRQFGNFLLNLLNKIASGYWNINDPQNGYVAISSKALTKINLDSLYKRYAFENDLMIKANIAEKIIIKNVPLEIRYNIGEHSKINYINFIYDTSLFLLRSFLWRIYQKYIKKGNLLGISYLIGTISFFLIPLVFIWNIVTPYVLLGLVLFIISCITESIKSRGDHK
ncbi:glycosyltransferase involved in cell wall biosynthesis [Methanococcus maripaludis]|uniref:Glycosyltransferase involved in cell wall biosynthesis n=1 Tax=Methanococcus maripaludis TaxID=39152 RepID=A0A7J9S5Z7_METMI|nr:glycosyltransferase family 2 protein [Methanococcus maripaludis]MBB6401730.1 glycosyltransferase involved in cell wall biosynthesis [Methanococcus maripaludis]